MGVESDKLRDLVDNVYPATIANIDSSLAAIQTEKDELNDQKDAIEWQMDQAAADTLSIVGGKTNVAVVYTFGDWNVLNLRDFEGHEDFTHLLTNPSIAGVGLVYCDGDATSFFPTGREMIVINTSATQFRVEVVSATYESGPDETHVQMTGDSMFGALSTINRLIYEWEGIGWDSDADIIENEDLFQASYAHLNDEISTTGTYGITDKLAKLDLAKTVLEADKAKYEDSVDQYDKFAT
jgi:hypothetical protein